MMCIRNKNDCKTAYVMLRFLQAHPQYAENEHTKELKRTVRKYVNRNDNELDLGYWKVYYRFVASSNDGEDYWELIGCPDWVESIEDAEEFFEEHIKIPIVYTYYSPTGWKFTSDHHCFKRNGKYYLYHRVSIDC